MSPGAAVLGAGAWGTALAVVLARRGVGVCLWARQPEVAAALARHRENVAYLPGVTLPEGVAPTADLSGALAGAGLIVVAIPSRVLAGGRFTAEGVGTALAAVRLAARHGIEMPIAQEVSAVLFEGRGPRQAAEALMTRALKFE